VKPPEGVLDRELGAAVGPIMTAMTKGADGRPPYYWLPTGEKEADRLDLQYHALNMTMGNRSYVAPIGPPTSVLDVGCGTGVWCAEIADAFPGARVVGLDAQAGAPRRRPDKYEFIQHDVLERLPFPDATFDYVHQRLLVAAIPLEDWPAVVAELARVTKPGGYVELLETWPRPSHDGPVTDEMWALIRKLERHVGHDIGGTVFNQLPKWLSGAGLDEVHEQVFVTPIGEWGGRVGVMMWRDIEDVYIGLAPVFSKRHLIKRESLFEKLQVMLREYEQSHGTFRFKVAWGRKP
jgi:SAM-dependent methyltransferase